MQVGQLLVASEGSVAILRNPDAFHSDATNGQSLAPYRITRPVMPNEALTASFMKEALKLMGDEVVTSGMNASADSFFSSQGRVDTSFEDLNENVLKELVDIHPNACSLEMETFYLFHLAACSKGACQYGYTSDFVSKKRIWILLPIYFLNIIKLINFRG